MSLLIGLENNVEGRSLAWALEYPGCFAYGNDPSSALEFVPSAFQDYRRWIAAHLQAESWLPEEPGAVQVVDTWDVYAIDEDFVVKVDGDYEVNAWFRHDWQPLGASDLQRASLLLEWSRADLLEAVSGLDLAALQASHPGERWSIAGILNHVAGAEWWYLDRLDLAFPRHLVAEDPFERLSQVRRHLLEVLPSLQGSQTVLGEYGEFWSPRKLLRRALWHERDHTAHILKLR